MTHDKHRDPIARSFAAIRPVMAALATALAVVASHSACASEHCPGHQCGLETKVYVPGDRIAPPFDLNVIEPPYDISADRRLRASLDQGQVIVAPNLRGNLMLTVGRVATGTTRVVLDGLPPQVAADIQWLDGDDEEEARAAADGAAGFAPDSTAATTRRALITLGVRNDPLPVPRTVTPTVAIVRDDGDGLRLPFDLLILDEAGSPDPRFGAAGVAVPVASDEEAVEVVDSARLPDGGVILIAQIGTGDGRIFVVRLDAAGMLDDGFGLGGAVAIGRMGASVRPIGVAAAEDDGFYLLGAGSAWTTAGPTPAHCYLERYDRRGALVDDFGNRGRLSLPQGRVRAVMTAETGPVLRSDSGLLALDEDGGRLLGFGDRGFVPNIPFTPEAMLNTSGGVIVAGAEIGAVLLVRLDATGEIDPGFGDGGLAIVPGDRPGQVERVTGLAEAGDGRLFVAIQATMDGDHHLVGSSIIALDRHGIRDRGFADVGSLPGLGPSVAITGLLVDDAGAVVVVGTRFIAGGASARGLIARYDHHGARDLAFGIDGRFDALPVVAPTLIPASPGDDGYLLFGTDPQGDAVTVRIRR